MSTKTFESTIEQKELATWIGKNLCNTSNLIPLGQHSTFLVNQSNFMAWYVDKICDIAFWAVGRRLQLIANSPSIIDHAWFVGYNGTPFEPWGIVTEPYIDKLDAERTADYANVVMSKWGIEVHVLSAGMASWNAGNCIPIVATFGRNGVKRFMEKAVIWALKQRETL